MPADNDTQLPILAIALGDPAGTGPELIAKALALPEIRALCRPLIVGDAAVLRAAQKYTGTTFEICSCADVSDATYAPETIDVFDLRNVDLAQLQLGKVSSMAGKAAYEAVKIAAELALAGKVDAIVTSAINKAAMNQAGYHYDGHTGLLAEVCQSPGATMMLAADKLLVSHVSTHVPLRVAVERVRPERIMIVLRLTNDAIKNLGVAKPKIAVAGLNPHAGENGLFGDEEQKYITPAIEEAKREGIDASGPYAGDTIFYRCAQGEFDAGVAMYHDQGHVAAKMLGIWRGVNVTLGLPIVRTSVEHGTDFANVGTGCGDPRSLVEAIKLAAIMAKNRRPAF